jgi:transposase-like protein
VDPVSETPAPVATPADPKQKPRIVLTSKQREKVVALWQVGDATLEDLAKQFGVSVRTLQNLFKRRGIQKGELKERITEAAKKEVERITRDAAQTLAGNRLSTKEELHRAIRYYTKMIVKLGIDAHQGSVAIETKRAGIQTCREAIAALKMAQEAQFPILGIKEDEQGEHEALPELPLIVLTDEEIRRQQAARASDLGDFGPQQILEATQQLDKGPLPTAAPEGKSGDPGPSK